jgi:predicted dehydrogenase
MEKVLLIGAGPMAVEYAKVLKALNVNFEVVGRGKESASQFEKEICKPVVTGGIENYLLANKTIPYKAIVAVGEKRLGQVTLNLIQKEVKYILVEKPGGYDAREIEQVFDASHNYDSKVFVAYNRRFYASVIKAIEIIQNDGGVKSFNFEFTEWGHVIKDLKKEEGVKEQWFLHNSTHVIDLAFFLGGKPKEVSCYVAGGLSWHPSGSIFAGAGITENGALFSYQANWEAPGRWGVEVLTKKHRLIFRPMEKLQIQKIGSVAVEFVDIDDKLDVDFKPGLFKQTECFIRGQSDKLLTISEQVENLNNYNKILNGQHNIGQLADYENAQSDMQHKENLKS